MYCHVNWEQDRNKFCSLSFFFCSPPIQFISKLAANTPADMYLLTGTVAIITPLFLEWMLCLKQNIHILASLFLFVTIILEGRCYLLQCFEDRKTNWGWGQEVICHRHIGRKVWHVNGIQVCMTVVFPLFPSASTAPGTGMGSNNKSKRCKRCGRLSLRRPSPAEIRLSLSRVCV